MTLKLLFTAFLPYVQRLGNSVENRPASLLIVPEEKKLYEIRQE